MIPLKCRKCGGTVERTGRCRGCGGDNAKHVAAADADKPSSMFMVMVVEPCGVSPGPLLPGDPIGFMPVYRTYDEAKLAWPERQILEVAHASHP